MLYILTRIGDNSKLVITGDTDQSDLGSGNGLSDFLTKYDKDSDLIKVTQFTIQDVERHPVVKEVLNLYK